MKFAISEFGKKKIEAYYCDKELNKCFKTRIKGFCPRCKEELIPHYAKNSVKNAHWEHQKNSICSEVMHQYRQKNNYNEKLYNHILDLSSIWNREKIITKNGISKKCFVKNKNGTIFYYLKGLISGDKIKEIEKFFGLNMVWIIDATNCSIEFFEERTQFEDKIGTDKEYYYKLKWYHIRKTLQFMKRSIYLIVDKKSVIKCKDNSYSEIGRDYIIQIRSDKNNFENDNPNIWGYKRSEHFLISKFK